MVVKNDECPSGRLDCQACMCGPKRQKTAKDLEIDTCGHWVMTAPRHGSTGDCLLFTIILKHFSKRDGTCLLAFCNMVLIQ